MSLLLRWRRGLALRATRGLAALQAFVAAASRGHVEALTPAPLLTQLLHGGVIGCRGGGGGGRSVGEGGPGGGGDICETFNRLMPG